MTLASLLAMIVTVPALTAGAGGKQPADGPDGRTAVGDAPARGWVQWLGYYGIVTDVSQYSISIRAPGQLVPSRFPINPELAEATVPPSGNADDSRYLPSDVRKGDVVSITYREDGRTVRCDEITILRRPGGRVPPGYARNLYPPGWPESKKYRHHERMNAYQDLEEKGIPLPEKYRPRGIPGKSSRPAATQTPGKS